MLMKIVRSTWNLIAHSEVTPLIVGVLAGFCAWYVSHEFFTILAR